MREYVDRSRLSAVGARNTIHSATVITAMLALFLVVGALFGGSLLPLVLLGLGVAFLGLGPSVGSRLLLRLDGAVPVTARDAPRLVLMLRELTHRAELPAVPQLYLVPAPAVTAYTTGTRDNAAIAVTDGLLRTLNLREIAGVLAHEVSHIRRNDVWLMGFANAIRRATHFLSTVGQILLFVNLPLVLMGRFAISWTAILLLMFAPMVSVLLQLALSRTREYQADADAVRLTGDTRGLASALAKLERANGGVLARFGVGRRGDGASPLLRSHPSTRDRIERILRLGQPRWQTSLA